jgi:hypothetical protein
VNHLSRADNTFQTTAKFWAEWPAQSFKFSKFRRRTGTCGRSKGITVVEEERAKLCLTDASRTAQHFTEYRFQLSRRTSNDLQYFRGRCLLLQRLTQFIEQPRVLDGDDSLGGEVRQELDLLFGKGRTSLR